MKERRHHAVYVHGIQNIKTINADRNEPQTCLFTIHSYIYLFTVQNKVACLQYDFKLPQIRICPSKDN